MEAVRLRKGISVGKYVDKEFKLDKKGVSVGKYVDRQLKPEMNETVNDSFSKKKRKKKWPTLEDLQNTRKYQQINWSYGNKPQPEWVVTGGHIFKFGYLGTVKKYDSMIIVWDKVYNCFDA